jgi:hypothetical protein
MGVGLDFNEDLLTRMAAQGGGAFYFIDSPDQAPHIFAEELKDLLSVVGQNLTITLLLSPDVRMVRQLNAYPAESGDHSVVFRLGDLFADELKTLLLELLVPALPHLGETEVARLRFDYDELGADTVTHHTLELPIVVNAVPEADFEGHAPNEEVTRTALLLQAARAREEAIRHADQGDFAQASQVLSASAEAISRSGLRDPELQQQHDMLREQAVDMDLGPQRYDSHTRKAHMTTSVYAERTSRLGDSLGVHSRVKQSHKAMERGGKTPGVITWHGGSFALAGMDRVRLGKADDNDIVIPEDQVEAHHCKIVRQGDDLILTDLGTSSGTFANGGLLPAGKPFRLSAGDVVTVGSRLLILGETSDRFSE